MAAMRVTVLAGAESAPFVRELASLLPGHELTVVTSVARDQWVHGLKRTPDADALMSGLRPEPESPTRRAAEELAALGAEPRWALDDDATLARQVLRTQLLAAGFGLAEVTAALSARLGLPATVVPVSEQRTELHLVVADGDERRAVPVEEHLAAGAVGAESLVVVSTDDSASEAALAAVRDADVVVLAPVRPTVTRTPLLRAGGLREALVARPAPVLAAPEADDPLAALADPLDLPVTAVASPGDVAAAVPA
jgi:LPPG:FO 2-phospho-L-lactate transferase